MNLSIPPLRSDTEKLTFLRFMLFEIFEMLGRRENAVVPRAVPGRGARALSR